MEWNYFLFSLALGWVLNFEFGVGLTNLPVSEVVELGHGSSMEHGLEVFL